MMTTSTDSRKTLGIIGLGAFGLFMAKHLGGHFALRGCDKTPPGDLPPGVAGNLVLSTLEETAGCDIVVFAVPLESLADVAKAAEPHLRPGALVLDVTSVKMRPAEILAALPARVDALCTHPLFGPQSGKDGIAGLRVALCPIRIADGRFDRVRRFLSDGLGLVCLTTTPEQHDREMARVQAMTHFMSRAFRKIDLQPSPMATTAYDKLREFSDIVQADSWDLFLTIQNGNPFAEEMRQSFLNELLEVEAGLTIRVDIKRKSHAYDIVIDSFLPDAWMGEVERRVPASGWVLIADENVAKRFSVADRAAEREHWRVLTLPAGEENKTLADYARLVETLLSLGIDRKTVIVAMGGGVVGDLAGFASASLLRGVRYVQVPTTLLSQVDSSVGGKTGVNAAAGKNLVGAFQQPELVLIDTSFLATLPPREYLSGMAEVAKYGVLGDGEFFARLVADADRLAPGDAGSAGGARDRALLDQVVAHCCRMKMEVVADDEREKGRRGLLNLGHTFGHVLESLSGFDGSVAHGEAVAVGMVMAARFSAARGLMREDERDRMTEGLRRLGLPVALSELGRGREDGGYWRRKLRPDIVRMILLKDKKADSGTLTLVLPHAIGDARLHRNIRAEDAVETMASFA